MARYLSDAWFDEVASTAPEPCPSADDSALVLQQKVTGCPGGDVQYHLRVAPGSVSIGRGVADDPDATFTEDYETAVAIATGGLTAQAALLAGRIRVAGNMATLAARQDDLTGLDPIPRAIRAATTY